MSEEEKTENQPTDDRPQSTENNNILAGPISIDKQKSTENMEVHHSQGITHQKKWTEYLLEFLMLFFAVFLGFIAENVRENSIERHREKEYVVSMIADMNRDITQLDSLNTKRQLKQQMIDSIILILDMPDPNLYGNQLYYFARWMPRPLRIITSDGTMQQLKNAGNLRLIRSRKAVDAIMEYDQLVRFGIISVEDREESLIQQTYPSLKKVFDTRIFEKMVSGMRINRYEGTPKLLHGDKESLNEFYSHIHFLKNVNSYSIEFAEKRKKMALQVIEVLRQEYNLED